MRKKIGMILAIIVAFSMSYILAIELYDHMPNKIEQIFKQITLEGVTYNEISISFSGVQYGEKVKREYLQAINEEMVKTLTESENVSGLNEITHNYSTTLKESENTIEIQTSNSGENWYYHFDLKNQEDIQYNTYYTLEIKGSGSVELLDALRNNGRKQLEDWGVDITESLYLKGDIEGKISKKQEARMVDLLLDRLQGSQTNYYEDDLNNTTCAYYGYTPWFKEYIQENDGEKTNMQIGFKYNEELNATEIIIAFPFYNMPF